jgi:TfoX/Sxy family transcriptional regulator of competence genes
MSTQQKTVDYILDQLGNADTISARKMFGEYALYCDSKVVALICDDQLFIKPTEAGKEFLKDPEMGHPYPGSKEYFHIEGDKWEEAKWLRELVQLTAQALPKPKPKKPKK